MLKKTPVTSVSHKKNQTERLMPSPQEPEEEALKMAKQLESDKHPAPLAFFLLFSFCLVFVAWIHQGQLERVSRSEGKVMARTDRWVISARIPDHDIREIHIGQRAVIRPPLRSASRPSWYSVEGTVRHIDTQADLNINGKRYYPIRIETAPSPPGERPTDWALGRPVSVQISIGQQPLWHAILDGFVSGNFQKKRTDQPHLHANLAVALQKS